MKKVSLIIKGFVYLTLVMALTGVTTSSVRSEKSPMLSKVSFAPINMALKSNGGAASASSTINDKFPVSGVIDGDRKGVNWGNGGGWNDATSGAFPDWVEVAFSATKTINEINVFTIQDNYGAPVVPTETMTFSKFGIKDFTVQYWNGSSWVTIQNGTVTGNNLVWKKLTFTGVQTSKIRININKTADGSYSRIAEIEAWGDTSSSADPKFPIRPY